MTYLAVFIFGAFIILLVLWYADSLNKKRALLEKDKTFKKADEVSRKVGSLSARDLVERSNRRWREKNSKDRI